MEAQSYLLPKDGGVVLIYCVIEKKGAMVSNLFHPALFCNNVSRIS